MRSVDFNFWSIFVFITLCPSAYHVFAWDMPFFFIFFTLTFYIFEYIFLVDINTF
jgi:hypothetical protein